MSMNLALMEKEEILQTLGDSLRDQVRRMSPRGARKFVKMWESALKDGNWTPVLDFVYRKYAPVDLATFVSDPYFLGASGDFIWPKVLEELKEINSGRYVEVIFTGGIGSAKTTGAVYTTVYQLYLLSCYTHPQLVFGQSPNDEIVFIVQSITAKLAKSVDYSRIRSMIEGSPYFQEQFMFNKYLESELRFPNRVILRPVSGSDTAAIGQNVMGGIIDELNYMAVTQNSKMSSEGGTYDQAVAVYNSISRRRKSRFMSMGKLPGILCLVSSRKYPGQFTDRKEEEAKTDPTIFVYDKRAWEVQPEGRYSGERFTVFVGDMTRKPRIVESPKEFKEDDAPLLMSVPIEYKEEFEADIINALREIAGVSTLARHPFIMDTDGPSLVFNDKNLPVLSANSTDFESDMIKVLPKRFQNLDQYRFCHVDLGLTSDSAGVACGYIREFIEISRGDHTEVMPVIVYDFVLEVRPPKGGEIKFFKIRDLFYKLKDLGLPIKWVTYDSYQSVDSMQILRSKGFVTGYQSMDTSRFPYEILKSAVRDRRIEGPENARLVKELISLESDPKTGRIDHPPNGSKDCSDAVAGVAHGLTMRKEIWIAHGVPITSIPVFTKKMVEEKEAK